MENNSVNEGQPDPVRSISVDENEANVEMASNVEETSSLPSSTPTTPKLDKPSKSWIILYIIISLKFILLFYYAQ